MPRAKNNRRQKRIQRRYNRDYQKILKQDSIVAPIIVPQPEWTRPGDIFVKFSLYDLSQTSFTGAGTVYRAN